MKAPGFGDNRKNTLRDMAVATGGVVSGTSSADVPLLLKELSLCKMATPNPVLSPINYLNVIPR